MKVHSVKAANYYKEIILENLYRLEDLMDYRKNKITKFIDVLQKIKFKEG